MNETRLIMGMPIKVDVVDKTVTHDEINKIFKYFEYVDSKFSTYKNDSEITQINERRLKKNNFSPDMKTIFELAELTKNQTRGYFDIYHEGLYNPSGIVKGWSIYNASKILDNDGFQNYYIDAGGDIQTKGVNSKGNVWTVGIKNPFNEIQIVKVLKIQNLGVATSGTYVRGQHIYNPVNHTDKITDIISLTVIGPNVYEADRFATPAFAMGKKGIEFIENLTGFAGYMIDTNGIATYTNNFNTYTG
jgi:FAD:protein FMN transferase